MASSRSGGREVAAENPATKCRFTGIGLLEGTARVYRYLMDTVVRSSPLQSKPLPFFSSACPSREVVDVLANKWVLYVLGVLRAAERPMRFGEIQRSVQGVTQKSLTKTLRALERDGLIDRQLFPTVPLRVEYGLTDLGRDAGPLLSAVHEWAKQNAGAISSARSMFDKQRLAE